MISFIYCGSPPGAGLPLSNGATGGREEEGARGERKSDRLRRRPQHIPPFYWRMAGTATRGGGSEGPWNKPQLWIPFTCHHCAPTRMNLSVVLTSSHLVTGNAGNLTD